MVNHNSETVDLEIRIFPLRDEGYPVEVALDRDQVYIGGYLPADVIPWVSSGDLVRDGERLFQALFGVGSPQREAWTAARQAAGGGECRVRLHLDVDAPELHTVPWELLRTPEEALISANANRPFSRFLPVALPWRSSDEAKDKKVLRVLVLISNPDDLGAKYNLASLDVEQERATLEGIVEEITAGSDFKLELTFLSPPTTLGRLTEALQDGTQDGASYDVLHYLGHGMYSERRQQAALLMQDAEGHTQIVRDDQLAQMVTLQSTRPRLIFLAACQSASRATSEAFTGLAPKLIQVGVPAVVAMQDTVSIETARRLNAKFYQRLVKQGRVDKALNEAREVLSAGDRPDVAVPVLLTRVRSSDLWGGDERGEILGAQKGQKQKIRKAFWQGLVRNIQRNRCTPIIGPRARGRWGPNLTRLIEKWDTDYGYPFLASNTPTPIAQYIAVKQGDAFPRYEVLDTLVDTLVEQLPEDLKPSTTPASLTDLVEHVGWQTLTADDPYDVHNVLASLDLPLYLTTNYDNFMTEALRSQGKEPIREICRWNELLDFVPSIFEDDPGYEPTPDAPLVYHLFGNDQEVDSLVLTEDHHFDFLMNVVAEPDRIHPIIRAAVTNTALMFVGFNFEDWGFRVLLHALVKHGQRRRGGLKHVGVQLDPTQAQIQTQDIEEARDYLELAFQVDNINVYLGSVQQFMAELREAWENERQ